MQCLEMCLLLPFPSYLLAMPAQDQAEAGMSVAFEYLMKVKEVLESHFCELISLGRATLD